MHEYIRKLQQWRDKYERFLDARPRVQSLENLSHYLIEFQYTKFDEVEVPGQYTEVRHTFVTGCPCSHHPPTLGQGQQPELREDTKVRAQVRELSFAWVLLEAVDYQGSRWIVNVFRGTTAFRPTLPSGGPHSTDIPYNERVWFKLSYGEEPLMMPRAQYLEPQEGK